MTYVRTFPLVQVEDRVTRQVLSENETMMVVRFGFQQGGVGALHNHPHHQSTYVETGKFRFTIGDEEFVVSKGDSFIIPSDAIHGCVCLEPGDLVDTFTPRRDDFL